MTELLDDIDKQIIALMDFNARLGYTAVGKKLGKTKQYVRHRFERLKEKGIVTGVHVVVDVTKLGYSYVRMLIKLSKATPDIESEMLKFFKQHKRCGWLVSLGGPYDLAAVLMVQSMSEYEKILDKFSTRFHEVLANVETSIGTKIWHFPHKILRDKPPHEQIIFGGAPENEQLDGTDKQILRALLEDGSANSVQLGQKVGLSPASILARLKRLEQDRIILAYRLSIDTELLGYQKYKVFLTALFLDEKFLKEFSAYCRDHKNILYITKAIGPYLLEFELLARNNKEYNEIVKELRTRFSDTIKDAHLAEEYGTHLVSYTPF